MNQTWRGYYYNQLSLDEHCTVDSFITGTQHEPNLYLSYPGVIQRSTVFYFRFQLLQRSFVFLPGLLCQAIYFPVRRGWDSFLQCTPGITNTKGKAFKPLVVLSSHHKLSYLDINDVTYLVQDKIGRCMSYKINFLFKVLSLSSCH